MRARLDVDRRRAQLHAVLALVLAEVGLGHRRADVEHGHTLAVDRHFHLLGKAHGQKRRAAEQAAERRVDQRRLDHVVAVGGKHVHHGCPAAGTERRAGNMGHLRAAVRNLERRRRRAGVAVADRQPADLAGGAQIALHQLRREVLDVGDVVEAGAHRIGRQIRVDIDVQPEQIAHRRGVFDAIESLERTPARSRVERRRSIHRGFQGIDHSRDGRRVGPRRAGRRHHARAQFADHLFSDFAVRVETRRVELGERQAPSSSAFAVTGRAIARDEIVL